FGGIIIIGVFSFIFWAFHSILVNAFSTYREQAADYGAALLSGHPAHLASALRKMARSSHWEHAEKSWRFLHSLSVMPLPTRHFITEDPAVLLARRITALQRLQENLEYS
ncbi:MAG: M48 family metalloprotease, partial [Firmicutes bacterium]|nr:M48 family metalloprotease [Bacillota bacterium]